MTSSIAPEPLFPSDFPAHLRRFSRHITAVQTRGHDDSATDLLFANIPADQPKPPPRYAPAHDSYDLKIHPTAVFRPNLFATNIERLFISVTPLWASAIDQLDRLMTWREPSRTTCWAVVYSLCWWYSLVLPAILAIIISLSIWPEYSTSVLFPPEKILSNKLQDGKANHHPIKPDSLEEEQIAEAAAVAAASLVPDAELLPSSSNRPLAHFDSRKSGNTSPPASSSTRKEDKSLKNLADQYKPVIYKYGGGIQSIAGELCDAHERWHNLFARRFLQPPPNFENLHPKSHTDQSKLELSPNVRFAIPFIPLLFFSLVLSTETIGRCISLALGFILFLLKPIQLRSKMVRDALDIDQAILRDVPTDRAFVLATLRKIYHQQEDGLDLVLKLLAKPASPPKLPSRPKRTSRHEETFEQSSITSANLTNAERISIRSSSYSSDLQSSHSGESGTPQKASSPSSRRDKILKFAKKANHVAEQGTEIIMRATHQGNQILNGQLPHRRADVKSSSKFTDSQTAVQLPSLIETKAQQFFSRLISSPDPINLRSTSGNLMNETTSITSTETSFNPLEINNNMGNSSSHLATSFFCYYGNMPGYLTIYSCSAHGLKSSPQSPSHPHLSFYSSLGQSLNFKKSILVLPLNQIQAMRKVSLLSLAGVWGSIDGIEIVEKSKRSDTDADDGDQSRPSSSTTLKMPSKLKHHTFKHVTRRDEAFLRILVIKDWEADEKPGWITV
ncbi:hypothetical protein O181_001242 [Austropuccinia psidii MF-1]|uniref:Uncharacterized protein n=1 Tax=Austropuccinia psidii MF-1 TaxID=1389203 RepID=A0A9Q3BA78_9BASI|nr:hypothetical protein [Austropuccinia psidii MF-1]